MNVLKLLINVVPMVIAPTLMDHFDVLVMRDILREDLFVKVINESSHFYLAKKKLRCTFKSVCIYAKELLFPRQLLVTFPTCVS
jgi:hypothetical protein